MEQEKKLERKGVKVIQPTNVIRNERGTVIQFTVDGQTWRRYTGRPRCSKNEQAQS